MVRYLRSDSVTGLTGGICVGSAETWASAVEIARPRLEPFDGHIQVRRESGEPEVVGEFTATPAAYRDSVHPLSLGQLARRDPSVLHCSDEAPPKLLIPSHQPRHGRSVCVLAMVSTFLSVAGGLVRYRFRFGRSQALPLLGLLCQHSRASAVRVESWLYSVRVLRMSPAATRR